jgi:hypothetical protein
MRLCRNRRGGIEGLPLQLMIIILVAAMGTTVIMGWMGSIEAPHTIGAVDVLSDDIELDGRGYTSAGHVEIRVTDGSGDPLRGATVVLSGLGVSDRNGKTAYGTTDSQGTVSFDGLRITMRGAAVGFISVSVSMSDYGENSSARIAVIA